MGIRNDNYNHLILYANFKTAIHKMILNPPPTFEEFNSITIKSFIDNYEKIIKKIDKYKKYHNKFLNLQIYSMSEKLNYINLKESIEELYNTIINNNN